MSRRIDALPVPVEKKPMKVIVLSLSRSGTLGLYRALQILGYTPYHLLECFVINGVQHTRIFKEAVIGHYNRLSGIKRLTRGDCDKWWAGFDALVEVSPILEPDVLKSYVQDPDVKFILTEREPKKWAASVNNTGGKVIDMAYSFPLGILKYFDSTLYHFLDTNVLVYRAWSCGTHPQDPDNEANLCQFYTDYIKMVKATIPADRLCHIQLDKEGVSWGNICPFLGVPTPNEDYPDRNEPDKFQAIVEGFLQPKVVAAALRFSALVVPAFGALGWVSMKYGPSVLAALK